MKRITKNLDALNNVDQKSKNPVLTFSIPKEVKDQLKNHFLAKGQTLSAGIRFVLEDYLKKNIHKKIM